MVYAEGEEIMRSRPFATILKDFPLLPYYCDLCWEKYQEASDLYPNKRLLRCKSCKNSYYCNKDCQKEAWNSFHKKECKYLGKSTDYWSKSIENRFVLRVLSRVRNGGDTAKETLPDGRIVQFHDLQSNIPEVKADKELYTVFKKVQKVLTEMMKEKCPSEEDLMELYGKIVVNCHQPYIDDKASYLGIFLNGSKVDHSCEPNAFWELDEKNTMVFKTTKEINGGFDAIRISYLTGSNLRLSKKERHVMLRQRFLFECTCNKCLNDNGDQETSKPECMDMPAIGVAS